MPRYDSTHFDPPAPVAMVTVRNPNSQKLQQNVAMLLDTGADVTLVPRSIELPLRIDTDEAERYELAGFDDQTSVTVAVR